LLIIQPDQQWGLFHSSIAVKTTDIFIDGLCRRFTWGGANGHTGVIIFLASFP
jgi:hypothetical protein